jgi:cytochrome c-type biogenesis protein CcmH/NrfG
MALARLAALIVAALACAWFVLGVRQARDTAAATKLVNSPRLSSSDARAAQSLLTSAGTLNPDRQVELLRAELALREREPARSLRLAEEVVRREPLNIEAWVVLARAAFKENDAPLLKLSVRQIGRLDPHGR